MNILPGRTVSSGPGGPTALLRYEQRWYTGSIQTETTSGKEGSGGRRYTLETVSRSCGLLRAFSNEQEALSLQDLVERTGYEKTAAFRLIRTLEQEGFLRRMSGNRYCSNVRMIASRRYRLGYGAQSGNSPFSATVTESLCRAGSQQGIDVLPLDNRYSARTALRNAAQLVAEGVDVAVEFQVHQRVAGAIAALFRQADIPLIAVEIPHPGAVYYGVDHYRAGLAAGQALGSWAKENWAGETTELLLLGLDIAGALPKLRLVGIEAAVRERLPGLASVRTLDTRGEFVRAFEVVRRYLSVSPKRRTLVAGVNDPIVLGALRAFEDAGRAHLCAAAGLGAYAEARAELRRSASRLIGSVAFFPEHYGEALIRLALDLLHKRSVPPAVYAPHQMITRQNLNRFYPHDSLC